MAEQGADGPGLVELLAGMPDVVARLLAEHRPDARARCRACRTPGTGTPGAPWPCTLARLARAAQALTDER